MNLLKLYEEISKKVSIDVIGNKLLPQLTPYLLDPNLTK
jgi:hypothetical protein